MAVEAIGFAGWAPAEKDWMGAHDHHHFTGQARQSPLHSNNNFTRQG
jgi:hypothetical protein